MEVYHSGRYMDLTIAKDIIAITDDKVKLPPNFNILGAVNIN